MEKEYRNCVGMVLFNKEGKVLVGERVNLENSWQFPQGGVEENETSMQAAYRELYEELGIKDAQLIYQYPKSLKYDFPKEILEKNSWDNKGQIQRWFLFYWNKPISNCTLDINEREFSKVTFMDIEEVCSGIINFKKEVYLEICKEFQVHIEKFRI